MNTQEANAKLETLIQEFQDKLKEAEEFASLHDITMRVKILGQSHRYVPAADGRPTIDDYWSDDYDADELNANDWDGEFSGWQNSSTFC
jgi:hypothetical protein